VKIEIACPSRELFGSDRSAVRLARLLAGLGHEVELALPAHRPERGLTRLAADSGIRAVPRPITVASSRGLGGIAPVRGAQTDADLTILNSLAVAARRGDKPPRVVVVREWLDPDSRRHRALAEWHRRRVVGAVAVSSGVAEQWRRCVGDSVPVAVCPNWIEPEWLEVESERERSGILFAGRLSSWKGQMVLADAYERAFCEPGPKPTLTFLGAEGPGSKFHGNAVELRRRCVERGWRLLDVDPDPRWAFAEAALVVVPSLRPEPFGNVILEALAAGARVIAFPGGGVDDIAPHFPDSVQVVQRSRGALAEALRQWWLEGGEAQTEEELARSRETIRREFTQDAVTPRWERLIEVASDRSTRADEH
jgi:glycosyltransferase involved in cell wall biosynthesis